MDDAVDKILDIFNELDGEDQWCLLCAIVAEYIEEVTDSEYDALLGLSELAKSVAYLLQEKDEMVH